MAPGRIWVDRNTAAGAAHALHEYGMSLVWGDGLDQALVPLTEHLARGTYRTKDEWLQIDPRGSHLDWERRLGAVPGSVDSPTGGKQVQRFTRLNFQFDETVFGARHSRGALKGAWSIRPMTQAEFDLPNTSVTPRAFWRDAARFLANGGGLCAEMDGQIGAIAFSSFRFENALEIGIETCTSFRGQGLGRTVAVAMIRDCLARRLEPVWSCRKENTASFHLAQQLGFLVTKELPYFRLPAPL
jgi:RimJ/RimL family protein N-acetyltransferase